MVDNERQNDIKFLFLLLLISEKIRKKISDILSSFLSAIHSRAFPFLSVTICCSRDKNEKVTFVVSKCVKVKRIYSLLIVIFLFFLLKNSVSLQINQNKSHIVIIVAKLFDSMYVCVQSMSWASSEENENMHSFSFFLSSFTFVIV